MKSSIPVLSRGQTHTIPTIVALVTARVVEQFFYELSHRETRHAGYEQLCHPSACPIEPHRSQEQFISLLLRLCALY